MTVYQRPGPPTPKNHHRSPMPRLGDRFMKAFRREPTPQVISSQFGTKVGSVYQLALLATADGTRIMLPMLTGNTFKEPHVKSKVFIQKLANSSVIGTANVTDPGKMLQCVKTFSAPAGGSKDFMTCGGDTNPYLEDVNGNEIKNFERCGKELVSSQVLKIDNCSNAVEKREEKRSVVIVLSTLRGFMNRIKQCISAAVFKSFWPYTSKREQRTKYVVSSFSQDG